MPSLQADVKGTRLNLVSLSALSGLSGRGKSPRRKVTIYPKPATVGTGATSPDRARGHGPPGGEWPMLLLGRTIPAMARLTDPEPVFPNMEGWGAAPRGCSVLELLLPLQGGPARGSHLTI